MRTEITLLTVEEAATALGLAKSTLAKMRLRGDGPPYIKLGTRRVAYRANDLAQWVESRSFCSTAQY